eukprot:scaffold15885_cov127-Isochrysis_galbana.AAC.10
MCACSRTTPDRGAEAGDQMYKAAPLASPRSAPHAPTPPCGPTPAGYSSVIRTTAAQSPCLLLLAQLRNGGDGAAEDHTERGEHKRADARRALLDIVKGSLKHRLRRHRDGPDGVTRERLVDHHADDAHHGGAAVVALDVQLELLTREARRVRVAHPEEGDDVARRLVGLLREDRVIQERNDEHNLRPREVRERRPRGPGAARHVGELDVLGE